MNARTYLLIFLALTALAACRPPRPVMDEPPPGATANEPASI